MAMFAFGHNSGDDDNDAAGKLSDLMGPGHVDHAVRQALQFCWMALPKERRNLDELAGQMRRLVDRAIGDFREDRDAFGGAK